MPNLRVEKVLSNLPSTLTADTVYAVRVGTGFDLYITDTTGLIAHKVNSESSSDTALNLNLTLIALGGF
jgi:hypothetical protein